MNTPAKSSPDYPFQAGYLGGSIRTAIIRLEAGAPRASVIADLEAALVAAARGDK